jgi:hypothetical protein
LVKESAPVTVKAESVPMALAPTRVTLPPALPVSTPVVITPALVSGTVIGRVRMRTWILFNIVWSTVVYNSVAHWIWAAWIVNVSNDAWFGRTSGPWQHLNLASYRAIETGLPMVRSTPTGISALIDAYGRPVAQLGQGVEGVIDVDLPSPARVPVYYVIGDWLLGVVIAGIIMQSVAASRVLRRAQLLLWTGWVGRVRAKPNVNDGRDV